MKRVIGTIIYTLFIIIVLGFIPLKFAIKSDDINLESTEYIICTQTAVTDCDWERILSYTDRTLAEAVENRNIVTEGMNFIDYSPIDGLFKVEDKYREGSNIFIVYGKKIDFLPKFYENTLYTCKSWDIVYPIKRYSILGKILPRKYLCFWDLIDLP